MSRTTDLQFGKPYPVGRPSYFAMHVLKALNETGFVKEFGPRVEKLILTVASREDDLGYSQIVTWHDGYAMDRIGLSDAKQFREVRDRAVRSGWLVWNPPDPYSRQPHGYFVQIPDYAQWVFQKRRSWGETPKLTPDIAPGETPKRPPTLPPQTPTAYLPSPDPVPEPLPPLEGREEEVLDAGEAENERTPAVAASVAMAEALDLAKHLHVGDPEETIGIALGHGVSLDHVVAILRHADQQPVYRHPERGSLRPWGGGAIWTRLRCASYVRQPPEQGFAKPDADWTRLHVAAQEAERRAEAPVRAAEATAKVEAILAQQQPAAGSPARKLKQLELDFGQKLDTFTLEEMVKVCLQAGGVTASTAFLSLVRKQGEKPTGIVRSRLLDAMATLAAAN